MNRPSISVIIPSYNAAQFVAEAVESVLAQTRPADEIIVVDDGSTDDTAAAVTQFAGKIQYIYQPNQGVATARNTGLARSTGELIAFLDADDIWHPRKLELQIRYFQDCPEIGLLGTGVFDFPTAEQPSSRSEPVPILRTIPITKLLIHNSLTTSSIVARRSIIDKVGHFDAALHGPEDYDLWLRIAEHSTVVVIQCPLTGYRTVPGSLGGQPGSMLAGLQRIGAKIDQRGTWRGHWLLRQKALSHRDCSCSYLYRQAGQYRRALWLLLSSCVRYPLPFQADEVRVRWARPKSFLVVMRLLISRLLSTSSPSPKEAAIP